MGNETNIKLSIIYEISKTINKVLDLPKLLDMIMDYAIKVMNADRGFLMLIDDKTGNLVPASARKIDIESTSDAQLTFSRRIIEKVVQSKSPLITLDAQTDPRFGGGGSIMLQNIRSAICVPMFQKEKMVGVIYLDNIADMRKYCNEDIDFLSAFASQAAVAIENAKLYEDIEKEIHIRTNLQRYLSPSVVEKIISIGENVQLGGDKIEVSIVFADIRNFTSIAESFDPHKVVDILNHFFTKLSGIVFKYQGTLDKYLGDGLLAIFTAPFPHSDDPIIAITAALEMQKEMKDSQNIIKSIINIDREISIGIGIATGVVVAGNIGSKDRMEYTVIGDSVNLASRIESEAKAGQILICPSTYQKVKDRVKVNCLGPTKIKGKEIPIELYEVIGIDS